MFRLRYVLMAAAMLLAVPGHSHSNNEERLTASDSYAVMPVKVMNKITLPRGYHEGLLLNGGKLWVCEGKGGKINVVDISSGTVTSTIEPIAGFTEAVTGVPRGALVATDWETRKIYRARLEGGRMVADFERSVAPSRPAGAVWAGGRLFVITWRRGWGTAFSLVEMNEKLDVVRKVKIERIQEPSQIAWDGDDLWVTSWYSGLVYRIDVDSMKITGYFPAPISRPTGIAWDGAHFWITGTYGDLYKVEVGRT